MTSKELDRKLAKLWKVNYENTQKELKHFRNKKLRKKYEEKARESYTELEALESANGLPWNYYKDLPIVKELGKPHADTIKEIQKLKTIEEESKCPGPKPETTVTIVETFKADGDIIITDPSYIYDWVYPEHTRDTIYGDWSCHVWECDPDTMKVESDTEAFGQFCADAGLVCVTDINTAHNRVMIEFFAKERPWCACIINGFKGKIWYEIHKNYYAYKGNWECDESLIVCGKGLKDGKPFAFTTLQTGL